MFFDSQESPLPFRSLIFSPLVALLAASPAYASGGIELPEPSGLLLLGMGVAGAILGRRFSTKNDPD
jgi:hypothetical protein